MRFAIMGSGGVGGYFGARLAAAGEEVRFIARGAHLDAMRKHGLKIESALGDIMIDPVDVTDDPRSIGAVDIVFFCVKLWDTESALDACRPLMDTETGVVSFQNGVEAEDEIASALGAAHALGGTAQISAEIAAPGLIRHAGRYARIEFGELDNRRSPRIERLLGSSADAGIDAAIPPDINEAIWRKFVMLSAMSAVNALTRAPIGTVLATPETRRLFERLVAEGAAVARAKGIAVSDRLEADIMEFVSGFPDTVKASMLKDLEHGRRLELEWLSGAVVRRGAEAGVPTPCHDVAYAALKPYADGPPPEGNE